MFKCETVSEQRPQMISNFKTETVIVGRGNYVRIQGEIY